MLYRNYCYFCSFHILRCLRSFHIIVVILHSISSIQSCKMLPICRLWSSLDKSRLHNPTTVILRCIKLLGTMEKTAPVSLEHQFYQRRKSSTGGGVILYSTHAACFFLHLVTSSSCRIYHVTFAITFFPNVT